MSEPFARVPIWILGRSDVSWPAKILYGLIARYVGPKGREAWPSIEQLRADMRTARRNIERWLEELREAGLIDVARTGRASTYRLLGTQPDEPPDGAVLVQRDPPEVADQIRQNRRVSDATSGASDTPEVADQIRQNQRIVAPASFNPEEIIEEIIEESPVAPKVESPLAEAEGVMKQARSELLRGYQQRYERATGEPWMGFSRAASDIDTCARVVMARGAAHVEERVRALLDHVFADEWMTDHRWPWAAIAKDPARYLTPPRPRRGRDGAVWLPAKVEHGGEDFPDDDIPTDAAGPQKVIGYG